MKKSTDDLTATAPDQIFDCGAVFLSNVCMLVFAPALSSLSTDEVLPCRFDEGGSVARCDFGDPEPTVRCVAGNLRGSSFGDDGAGRGLFCVYTEEAGNVVES